MFSEEALKKARDIYNEQAQEMRNLKAKLTAAVDDIREGWNSSAGDEFFKKYDEQWIVNINDYIDVIQHMSDNMDIANNKYQTVYDYAEKIKLH
jgi:WXG100 family type VII secretion target